MLRVREIKPTTVAKRSRLELSTVMNGTTKTVKRSFLLGW
ncbi:MAG: hypothetical protein ACJAYX_003705 [Planctomycetota bacterium]|jgi:hypothetical protein